MLRGIRPPITFLGGETFMKKSLLQWKEFSYALASTLPALILFILFVYYPLFMTFIYSFTDWNGFSDRYRFVGFDNFGTVFREKDNWLSFWNTIYFSVLSIVLGTVIQLVLAVLIHMKIKGRTFMRSVIYLPAVISPLIIGLTWNSFMQYTGIINEFFVKLGWPGGVTDWLGDPGVVKNSLVFINLWQFTGVGMVIFLAGMNSIPQEVNESATLDGAVRFRQFRSITLPLIMPFMTIVLFMGITGALKVFELPFIMTNGGPIGASKSIVMSIYENAFGYQRFGVASAIGIVFFLFIAGITLLQLHMTRKRETEY